MIIKNICKAAVNALVIFIFFNSCSEEKKKSALENFQYQKFKDSLQIENKKVLNDTSNVFDGKVFTPGIDSLDTLLIKIDTLWHRELALMEQLDTLIRHLKTEEKFTDEEKGKIRENVKMLDSFLLGNQGSKPSYCIGNECLLYAEIIKSTQTLYLYIEGEIKDSFKVSTGIKKYETPRLNLRPAGPVLTKYTSRKYPGGNYKGLGNMPYAVFLRGGYAIHDTTPGNFAKLGTRASHGCIRLHPDNARIFYELVKLTGLHNTWVTIRDSL